MKKFLRYALLTAGPVKYSLPSRFPELITSLGPVRAESPRTSARISNTLRAGIPSANWDDVADCGLILVSGDSVRLKRLLIEMSLNGSHWVGKCFLLDEPSSNLHDLARQLFPRSFVATLSQAQPPSAQTYLLDGHRRVIGPSRQLLRSAGAKVIILRAETRPFYLASITIIKLLAPAILDSAVAGLRHAGISGRPARKIVEINFEQALRAFNKGGKYSFKEPRRKDERDAFLGLVAELRQGEPRLAEFLLVSLESSLTVLGKDSSWLTAGREKIGAGS